MKTNEIILAKLQLAEIRRKMNDMLGTQGFDMGIFKALAKEESTLIRKIIKV